MTEKFVASNGIPIIEKDWGLSFTQGVDLGTLTGVSDDQANALREYFQHERDRELGRWRWPENPEWVMYQGGPGSVWVFDEDDPYLTRIYCSEVSRVPFSHNSALGAATAYFAAHHEPKPWHDAKPGEVWAIVTENVAEEVAVQRTPNGLWQFCDGVVRDDELPIESARRIWPVSDA